MQEDSAKNANKQIQQETNDERIETVTQDIR